MSKLTKKQLASLELYFIQLDNQTVTAVANSFFDSLTYIKQNDFLEGDYVKQVFHFTAPQKTNEILCHGIYGYYKHGNSIKLLNHISTYNRMEFAKRKSSNRLINPSSNAICSYEILKCYASNDIDLVNQYMNQEITGEKRAPRWSRTLSLALEFIHQPNEYDSIHVLSEINECLKLKLNKYVASIILTLKAIIEKDVINISDGLKDCSALYVKATAFHNFFSPINKYLPIHAIGLYSLAKSVLSKDSFEQITQPSHWSWPKAYCEQCIKKDGLEGEILELFTGELNFLQTYINGT
jgi:hypothetical protein